MTDLIFDFFIQRFRGMNITLIKIGILAFSFIVGSSLIHVTVMVIDHYLLPDIYTSAQQPFFKLVFSQNMLPMMVAYGSLSVIIVWLYMKINAVKAISEKAKTEKEKVTSVMRCMQRLTGILAEQISTTNAEILQYINKRNEKGKTVSPKIEQAAIKIATAMQSLSEISFIYPYSDECPVNLDDIEKIVQQNINLRITPSEDVLSH